MRWKCSEKPTGEGQISAAVSDRVAPRVVLLSRSTGEEQLGGAKLRRDLLQAAQRAGFECVTLSARGWRYFLALARVSLPRRSVVIVPYPDIPAIRAGGILKAIGSLCEAGLLMIKKCCGRWKLLLFVHDLPIEQREMVGDTSTHPLCRFAEAVSFRCSDIIGVMGAEMERMIRRRHTLPSASFVYYGFIPHYACQVEKNEGPGYPRKIGFVGNLSKTRIEKLVRMLPSNPGIEYCFYGPGGDWLEETRQDFRWYGTVPAETLPASLNANADFGLLLYDTSNPLWLEYLHMATTAKFFTYLYAGIPILAYSYRHIAEVIRSHGLGYVFDDPANLAGMALGVDEVSYRETAQRVARFARELASRNLLAEFVEAALEVTRKR